MQVKVFESTDMASGLRKVRKALGPDALILSTRTLKNSRLGILGKSMFEITAATDDRHTDHRGRFKALPEDATVQQPATYNRGGWPAKPIKRAVSKANNANLNQPLKAEIVELKSLIQSLAGEVSALKNRPVSGLSDGDSSLPPATADQPGQHFDAITHFLQEHEVSSAIAQKISGYARESLSYAQLNDPTKVFEFLRATLADLISVAPPDFSNPEITKKIAVVGPTGVGKTTTLAKIAANYICEYGQAVAFITIDTYRIAAIEQLKVYGEIMRIPVEVVLSPSQFSEAIKKFEDKKLLLIDTAGRSPKDSQSIDELSAFFQPVSAVEKHLVLSAATRETEWLDILEKFGSIGIDKTIITKIDECTKLGSLINTQLINSKPLSYITNGQRVPEDIIHPDQHSVPKLLVPEQASY